MNECVCRFQHHTTKLRVVLRAFPQKKNAQQQRESSSSSRCVVARCSNNEREESLLLSRKVSLSLLLSKCAQSREKKDEMKLFKNLSLLSLYYWISFFFFTFRV